MSDLLSGFYDTNMGKKQEKASYQRIAQRHWLGGSESAIRLGCRSGVDGGIRSGMQVVASVRPNNKPLDPSYSGPAVDSFDQIHIERIG